MSQSPSSILQTSIYYACIGWVQTTTANIDAEKDTKINPTELSDSNKHHQTLLMDNAEDGWASELHHYLGMMQHDVRKDTNLVEWWQVI